MQNPELRNSWHQAHSARISKIAAKMVELFTYVPDAPQTPEYEQTKQEYLWHLHEKMEHDKFNPPDYGGHRNG